MKNQTITQKQTAIRVKSGAKAGGITQNHNETERPGGIRVKSGAKAGGLGSNHNETLRALAVRTSLRAGTIILED